MDQDKKQKILIAVLAVAAIGAGGYFFFMRESGSDAPALVEGSTARKERAATGDEPAKTTERRERSERATTTAEAPALDRRERVERTEDVSGRRSRTKGPAEIKKSKKIVPAA